MTDPELQKAWRSVANAKLAEYRRQCWRIAGLVQAGVINKADAVDALFNIATAHALVRSLGEDRVTAIVSEAFAGADFDPLRAELVA
jgi:hypothetical protein